jgi:hypothetical protein
MRGWGTGLPRSELEVSGTGYSVWRPPSWSGESVYLSAHLTAQKVELLQSYERDRYAKQAAEIKGVMERLKTENPEGKQGLRQVHWWIAGTGWEIAKRSFAHASCA